MQREFFRFLLVGLTNTLISYLLFLLLLTFLNYFSAYTIAYCVGIIVSYFLNVFFVFKKKIKLTSFLKFPVVYVIQYILGATILWVFVDQLDMAPTLAMIAVIGVTIPITFLVTRFVLTS